MTQPFLHRILQLLALQIVVDLIGRRLADIQHGLPFQVMGLDLLTHRTPPRTSVRHLVCGPAVAVGASAIAKSFVESRGIVAANLVSDAGEQTASVEWISVELTTPTSAPP